MDEMDDFKECWRERREAWRQAPERPKEEPFSRRELRGLRDDIPDYVYHVIHNSVDSLDYIELWRLKVEDDGIRMTGGVRAENCWRIYFERCIWDGGKRRTRDEKELKTRYRVPKKRCHERLEDALDELRAQVAICAQRERYNLSQAEERLIQAKKDLETHQVALDRASNFTIAVADLDLSIQGRLSFDTGP